MKQNYLYVLRNLAAVTLLLFLGVKSAQSQTISYPSTAQNLIRGYGQSLLTVKVDFGSSCAGSKVRVSLPQSITYVPGSVATLSGSTAGLTITQDNITDLRKPEFVVNGTISTGSSIIFTIARKAGCGTFTGTTKDTVQVFNGCNVIENNPTVNNYNLYAPALAITPPPAITNALVGATATRNIIVTNGGNNTALDTLRFYVVYPNAGIVNTTSSKSVTVSGTSFAPSSTSGDTFFYKIFGATIFGGNNLMENGESVTIQEPIKVLKCGTTTTYGAGWGPDAANVCQWQTGTSALTMAAGTPNFSALAGARVNYVNNCTPFDITLTMTNAGTGNTTAAGMYNMKFNVGDAGSNVVVGPYNVDTNIIMFRNVRINGNVIPASRISWIVGANSGTGGISVLQVDLNDLFPTTGPDPDGAGGLSDLDGDGFYDDLIAGQSFTATIEVVFKPHACGYVSSFNNVGAKIFYDNMCGTALVSDGRVTSPGIISRTGTINGTAHVPANVLGGQPFQFAAKYTANQFARIPRPANARYRWKIVLPAGFAVSATPNARYGNTLTSAWTQVGDTIIYADPTYPSTSGSALPQNFYIDLVYTCGTGGNKDFLYFLEEVNDGIGTANECKVWGNLICETITTEAKCPSPCPAGPTVYLPQVRRANGSLGFTDNTLSTRQSASLVSAYDLSKAMYMDTIHVIASAKQNNAASNLYIHLDLPKTSVTNIGLNKLTPISVTSIVYRAGTAISSTNFTTTTSDVTASTSTSQVIKWNLTAGLPTGGLLPGDSIVTTSRYVVATNQGLPLQDIQSGGKWYFYNLVAGAEEYCDSWVPEMYLVGTYTSNGTNAFNTTGCAAVTLGTNTWNLARRMNAAGQIFETEFRPAYYIDSIVIDVPSEYFINSTSLITNQANLDNASLGTSNTLNVSPNYSVGTKHTFINPNDGTWKHFNITKLNNYGGIFNVNVSPTCATQPSMQTSAKVYIRDYYYAYAQPGVITAAPTGLNYVMNTSTTANIASDPAGTIRSINYSSSGTPNLTLQNITGDVVATTTEHQWTLQIGNGGLNTAPYTWIAIPNHSGITVTEVLDGTTVMAPISYTGGKMYRLSTTGIASGTTKNYDIKFTYTACTRDSLLVLGGWNCASYPATPAEYICGMDSIYLKVVPQASEVQLSVERHPGGTTGGINLCSIDSTILVLTSAQAAYLKEPNVMFYPPTGVTLEQPVMVEFPQGSGAYQAATVTSVGSGYKIDLTGHTGIGTAGINGTAANPSVNLRNARIVVRFNTTCNFTSGASFSFNALGKRPCGAVAEGNNVSATTNRLRINGVSTTGTVDVVSALTVDSVGCGGTVLSGVLTPIASPTGATDTMIITLPAGLEFTGNLTGSAGVVPVTGYPQTTASGTRVMRVKLPSGTATGTAMTYSVGVSPLAASGCGSFSIMTEVERTGAILNCGANPCPSGAKSIVGSKDTTLKVGKGDIEITNMTLSGGGAHTIGNNTYSVSIKNSGTSAIAANSVSLGFFCGSSTSAFDTKLFPTAIAADATVTANITVNVPGTPTCAANSLVKVVANPSTASNCLCDMSEFTLGTPLPVDVLSFDAIKEGKEVKTSWTVARERNVKQYHVEHSVDAAIYSRIGTKPAIGNSTYDLNHSHPVVGANYYRLIVEDMDGSINTSGAVRVMFDNGTGIKIYPNPASDKLTIELPSTPKDGLYQIMDVYGREVMTGKGLTSGKNVLNVGGIVSGTYFIRLTLDGSSEVYKLTIVR